MEHLEKHEQFELEVLQKMHNAKLLNKLIFVGGTMLRLCHGLDRYSMDLDFWTVDKIDETKLFSDLKNLFEENYKILDSQNKHYTIVFEIKSDSYLQKLKIEIRKEPKKIKFEKSIAYSPSSNIQVMLNSITLDEIMKAKIEAFLNRREIRDVYDIEFLFKKGIKLNIDKNTAEKIVKGINNLTKNDYKIKLGSILEPEKRKYYNDANFRILKSYLQGIVNQ
ncbi:nucleotidyl transferase AbiEii/AbiGii toxin family protein [Hippea alviniae]|uniref:nucleotidyl transferase AbiEii/AbiGii toxin family protein n=1 Tax=Hippea alviniae TaxID=1279027 RepID=UPI0003B4F524|nr:nucleotidyl transferase AbiEii/AbiGii toxin family protein [Hippea alviniae]